jgi:Flp pilus assembly protein TadG
MRRLNDERGAVAVMVALLMVPLLVCTALVVDVGSAYVRKRQLQNAADAAVLAVAQDCAGGACGNISSTATTFAAANVGAGTATANPSVSGSTATVSTSSTVDFFFAPVIGIDDTQVTATATAVWGSPTGGRAALPLGFSWCAFAAQTGGGVPSTTTPATIMLPKTDATACSGPTGNPVPGGFAWLKADSTGCTTTSSITGQTPSDPGRSLPSICSPADFVALQNKVVLLPVYEAFGGTGSNAWYDTTVTSRSN